MSYETHFEGDDSGRTWRAPDVARYIPRVPRERITVRINIRKPEIPVRDITNEPPKPERPVVTFEGGDAAEGEIAEQRRQQERSYPPELIESWRRQAEELKKDKKTN